MMSSHLYFPFSRLFLIFYFLHLILHFVFYLVFNALNLQTVGIIILAIFGLIGFVIATFKVPDTTAFEITRKTGGENIDDVIRRAFKFKMEHNKVYLYTIEPKNEKTKEEEGGKENG